MTNHYFFVLALTLAVASMAAPTDEEAPAKIDPSEIAIIKGGLVEFSGKYTGGAKWGYGLSNIGGVSHRYQYRKDQFFEFAHSETDAVVSQSGTSPSYIDVRGYFNPYYNRFYRADGTEVTEEEEIAKYNTSFQNQDDEDALISE